MLEFLGQIFESEEERAERLRREQAAVDAAGRETEEQGTEASAESAEEQPTEPSTPQDTTVTIDGHEYDMTNFGDDAAEVSAIEATFSDDDVARVQQIERMLLNYHQPVEIAAGPNWTLANAIPRYMDFNADAAQAVAGGVRENMAVFARAIMGTSRNADGSHNEGDWLGGIGNGLASPFSAVGALGGWANETITSATGLWSRYTDTERAERAHAFAVAYVAALNEENSEVSDLPFFSMSGPSLLTRNFGEAMEALFASFCSLPFIGAVVPYISGAFAVATEVISNIAQFVTGERSWSEIGQIFTDKVNEMKEQVAENRGVSLRDLTMRGISDSQRADVGERLRAMGNIAGLEGNQLRDITKILANGGIYRGLDGTYYSIESENGVPASAPVEHPERPGEYVTGGSLQDARVDAILPDLDLGDGVNDYEKGLVGGAIVAGTLTAGAAAWVAPKVGRAGLGGIRTGLNMVDRLRIMRIAVTSGFLNGLHEGYAAGRAGRLLPFDTVVKSSGRHNIALRNRFDRYTNLADQAARFDRRAQNATNALERLQLKYPDGSGTKAVNRTMRHLQDAIKSAENSARHYRVQAGDDLARHRINRRNMDPRRLKMFERLGWEGWGAGDLGRVSASGHARAARTGDFHGGAGRDMQKMANRFHVAPSDLTNARLTARNALNAAHATADVLVRTPRVAESAAQVLLSRLQGHARAAADMSGALRSLISTANRVGSTATMAQLRTLADAAIEAQRVATEAARTAAALQTTAEAAEITRAADAARDTQRLAQAALEAYRVELRAANAALDLGRVTELADQSRRLLDAAESQAELARIATTVAGDARALQAAHVINHPELLRTLRPETLAHIDPAVLRHISANNLGHIPADAFAQIGARIDDIPTSAFSGMTAEQLRALAGAEGMTDARVAAILTSERLAHLAPDVIGAINPQVFSHMDADGAARAISAMSPEALRHLSVEQFRVISQTIPTERLGSLFNDVARLESLNPAILSSMSSELVQAINLSPASIQRLNQTIGSQARGSNLGEALLRGPGGAEAFADQELARGERIAAGGDAKIERISQNIVERSEGARALVNAGEAVEDLVQAERITSRATGMGRLALGIGKGVGRAFGIAGRIPVLNRVPVVGWALTAAGTGAGLYFINEGMELAREAFENNQLSQAEMDQITAINDRMRLAHCDVTGLGVEAYCTQQYYAAPEHLRRFLLEPTSGLVDGFDPEAAWEAHLAGETTQTGETQTVEDLHQVAISSYVSQQSLEAVERMNAFFRDYDAGASTRGPRFSSVDRNDIVSIHVETLDTPNLHPLHARSEAIVEQQNLLSS